MYSKEQTVGVAFILLKLCKIVLVWKYSLKVYCTVKYDVFLETQKYSILVTLPECRMEVRFYNDDIGKFGFPIALQSTSGVQF